MVHSIYTYNITKLLTQQDKFLPIKPIKSNEIQRGISAIRASSNISSDYSIIFSEMERNQMQIQIPF